VPRLYVERIPGMGDENRAARAYLDPQRSGVQFWDALRLTTSLVVGPDPRQRRDDRRTVWAMIDTGAPLTLFPEHVWTQFRPTLIEFVSVPPGTIPPPLSAAGVRCPYRLGWIWLGVRAEMYPRGNSGPDGSWPSSPRTAGGCDRTFWSGYPRAF
jgi:hypothetical protein